MNQNPLGGLGGLLGGGGPWFGHGDGRALDPSQDRIDQQPRTEHAQLMNKMNARIQSGANLSNQADQLRRNTEALQEHTRAIEDLHGSKFVEHGRIERESHLHNSIRVYLSSGDYIRIDRREIFMNRDVMAVFAHSPTEKRVEVLVEKIVRVPIRRASWWRLICCRVGLHWTLWSQPDRQGLRRGKCACCPKRDVTGPKGCVVDVE